MYPRNAASPERIAIGAVVQISDGAVQTSGVSIKVKPQGATASAGGGTTSYEEGIVEYVPTQAETNYTSFEVIAYKTGCIPVATTVVTTASATPGTVLLAPVTHTSAVIPTVTTLTGHTAQTGDAFARLGAPAGASVSADVAAVKTQTAAIEVDTQDIQSRLPAALVSGRIDASVGAMASGVLTATAIAADAITAAKIADGAIDAATFAAGAINAAAIAADAITDAKVASDVTIASVTGSVGSVTGNVGGNLVGTIGGMSAAALADFFDTNSGTTYASAVAGSVVKEIADNAGGSALTAGAIADAVWDEALAGHVSAGSTGEALNAAGAAGDPWITTLPGSYTSGQAGYIVGTNLNATVSSRLATAGYTAPLDAAGTRTALGLASANLDTQLSAIDTVVDAVLVDTAEIGAAGAGLTALASATNLATLAGYVDTEVAAIKAKTDNLPASPAAVSDIPTATQNADALLNRDMSAVSDTNARSPLNALRFLRNKWSISGTTLTVTKENDSTSAWTATVTAAPGADPISGNDPT